LFSRKRDKLFSIVIPTLNEGSMLSMTVENILEVTAYPNIEVVIVDDGSTDGSCDVYQDTTKPVRVITANHLGIPRARNLGADEARGEYVLFIDAHCTVSANWIDRFITALAARDVAIVGPTFTRLHEPQPRGCGNVWINHRLESAWLEPLDSDWPYEVPITPGGCQAFRRKVFLRLGGFEAGFSRWGYQDEEICLRAWLQGYRVLVDPEVVVAHYFRDQAGYEVDHSDVLYNFLRLIHLHFSPSRIRRCIAALGEYPGLEETIDRLYASDVFQKRNAMTATQRRTEDWLFRVFMPDLQLMAGTT
jgi:glycosyltransferase involved in cell wall biosynthesis